uniref:Adaptor protein ClpS core domain-containing protein n=2 Tax=Hemiselmis andersenii TaxID=464988 RepID=A0A7S0Y2B2_HEMAN
MSKTLVLALLLVATATAWSPPTLGNFRPAQCNQATCGPRAQLASPQIAKPKVEVGNPMKQPSTAPGAPKTSTPKPKLAKKTQDDEAPMYKVILLGDPEYEQSHVVTQITKVIPSVKKEEATRCYVEAQMMGTSVIITVTEEHAEHYVQQLKRQQIYAKMEKESRGGGGSD